MGDYPKILLVYPRFSSARFMGHYETSCELVGARQILPPLGLLTVAALLPRNWQVCFVDSNIDPLTDADIRWSDLVMTGGMLSQQTDTLGIIARVCALGRQVVVGGPDISSSPEIYAEADFRVLGEAEAVLGAMLEAWLGGAPGGTFQGRIEDVNLQESPVPRFDLINPDHYMQVGLQFSRGCPFTCEFCDIIELYGRVPRVKTIGQILAELDAIRASGYRGLVYFVDDNLIGNKRALRPAVQAIREWQEKHRFPFQFYTAASLNLADDPVLLAELRDAGFMSVFIGIETGDATVLHDIRKKQNTRRDIAENIRRIQQGGLLVTAGFIVGFDGESDGIAADMIELIESSAIGLCFVSLLYALPNTQLSRRLTAEGRLLPNTDLSRFVDVDTTLTGLNFEPTRPREAIVGDFASILARLYHPDAFFARAERVAETLKPGAVLGTSDPRAILKDLRRWAFFMIRFHRRYPELARPLWKSVGRTLRRNPRAVKALLIMAGMYPHMRSFSAAVGRAAAQQRLDRHEPAWSDADMALARTA